MLRIVSSSISNCLRRCHLDEVVYNKPAPAPSTCICNVIRPRYGRPTDGDANTRPWHLHLCQPEHEDTRIAKRVLACTLPVGWYSQPHFPDTSDILILSHLDYGNVVLESLPAYLVCRPTTVGTKWFHKDIFQQRCSNHIWCACQTTLPGCASRQECIQYMIVLGSSRDCPKLLDCLTCRVQAASTLLVWSCHQFSCSLLAVKPSRFCHRTWHRQQLCLFFANDWKLDSFANLIPTLFLVWIAYKTSQWHWGHSVTEALLIDWLIDWSVYLINMTYYQVLTICWSLVVSIGL